jgi:predicted  nucleic acid-binding Zn-ribbon protein
MIAPDTAKRYSDAKRKVDACRKFIAVLDGESSEANMALIAMSFEINELASKILSAVEEGRSAETAADAYRALRAERAQALAQDTETRERLIALEEELGRLHSELKAARSAVMAEVEALGVTR